MASLPPEADGLLGLLVQRNYDDYASMTQRLLDSLNEQVAVHEATLLCIRTVIESLYDGPYVPSQERVLGALYPEADLVGMYRRPQ